MKKKIGMLAALVLVSSILAGCSGLSSIISNITGNKSTVSMASGDRKETIVGQITEINGTKLTLLRYERVDVSSETESAASSAEPASSGTSSATSSKKTVSSQLTMDWFNLTLYTLTEQTTVCDLGAEPCILIPDGAGGWTGGSSADLIVGDTIVMIDDAVSGEGVWRIAAAERPAS